MCLGVPGEVISIRDSGPGLPMGEVDLGGVQRDVCLAYVPDVQVGDFVIVHAGFAISRLEAQEAMEIFDLLKEIDGAPGTDVADDGASTIRGDKT